jgi:outer membrane receptor for ferrienterochelin and colicin
MKRSLLVLLITWTVAAGAFAQTVATSTLTGKVTSEGLPIPGVTVTVTSPSLQGARTVTTTGAGDYIIPFLAPGDYTITFELAGMQTVSRTTTLAAARTDQLNIELSPATVAEEITVTAEAPLTAPVEATEVAVNFRQDLIDILPTGRSLQAVTLLAPGANSNGPGDNIVISGAMSFDTLYLVNGAIVNENLRGQARPVFIEDAIEETTVMTGAISAEYGHFTGGVVNAITKSGGNDFKGSFRDSLTNESWTEKTPLTAEQDNTTNSVYEATIGGPFWRDKLWFFGAGRYAEAETIRQTVPGLARTGDQDANGVQIPVGTPIPPITYPNGTEETRLEAKLTWAMTPSHKLLGSYIDVDASETNQTGQSIMDLDSLVKQRETPDSMFAFNYSGVLSDSFFVEAQYSKKEFAFLGSGSPYIDDPATGGYKGTLIQDRARGTRYWSPTFRASPGGEHRDIESYAVKGTYFLSTSSAGTHELKAGYEHFLEVRDVNNYQNGSDYRVSLSQSIVRGDQIFGRFAGGSSGTLTRISWLPILILSDGSEYASDSFFVNDRWSLNNHWTINLGLRYDKNDAVSGDGELQVADDEAFSPRLAATYDVRGDGRLVFTASYGQYVGRLAEGAANDGDPAGRNASFSWNYRGPSINNSVTAPTGSLVGTEAALKAIFDWFFANGGTSLRPFRTPPSVPGVVDILDPAGLTSPNVKEWTLGVGTAIGSRGYVRADLVWRNWDDFYISNVNLGTGQVTDEYGNTYDQAIVSNDSDDLEREYTGVHTQFRYRFSDRWDFGGTYTWSRLVGNVTGEDSGSGPLVDDAGERPEYWEARWEHPMGYLTGDQRHRARIWLNYDLPTAIGNFTFSLLENFDSGTRTSVDGTIDPSPYVENPGYISEETSKPYYFGGRGNLSTDDITRTDFSLTYRLPLGPIELFLQGDVLNLFNEKGVQSYDEEVLTNNDVDYLAPFNPFTDTPVECPQGAPASECQAMGANFQRGPNFGLPNSEGDWQTPRTYRFSIGFRF